MGGAEIMVAGSCVFDGMSISMEDFLIERRPYHRNCGCKLHIKNGSCPHPPFKTSSLSFMRNQKWTKTTSLHIQSASKFSSLPSPLRHPEPDIITDELM